MVSDNRWLDGQVQQAGYAYVTWWGCFGYQWLPEKASQRVRNDPNFEGQAMLR